MSPINIKKLNKLRKKLDSLDNKLLRLIKIRTGLVKNVLKLKTYKLNNIRKKSIKQKIDPKITNRIWKNMILSYIDFEKRNFKKK